MFFPIRISGGCEEAGHQAEFKVDASSFSIRIDVFVVYHMISMSDSFGTKYFQALEINIITVCDVFQGSKAIMEDEIEQRDLDSINLIDWKSLQIFFCKYGNSKQISG